MDNLPVTVFQSENRRYPKRDPGKFIGSANLGLSPFNFDNVGEFRPDILRDSFEARGLTFPQLRNRPIHRLLNFTPAPNRRAERIC